MNKKIKFFFLILINLSFISNNVCSEINKIKIGLLVPLTGDNAKLGNQILNSVRLAIKDINSAQLEIFPKDTQSDPNKTLRSAIELEKIGINVVIGPVFYENIIYLNELENITFLSLTNKTLDIPKNVVTTGINSTSQLNTIKKFIELTELTKQFF